MFGASCLRATTVVVITLSGVFASVPALAGPVIVNPAKDSTITPGGTFGLDSGRWYPPTGCTNKIKVTVKDAAGKTWTLGRYTPRFSLYEKQFPYQIHDASVDVPEGMEPGEARLTARQTWSFKFPIINVCIDLFSKSVSRSINGSGAVGNSPPVITDLSGPAERRQRTTQPITWTSSEACAMTLTLLQEIGGVMVELGPIVEDHPGIAGANAYEWDSTFGGADLTTGTYRLQARCVEGGSASAPVFTSFEMGFVH